MFYNKNASTPLDSLFEKHAQANGLRYDFLRNIGQIESNYNAQARAKTSTAKGVMQLIDGTGHDMGLQSEADFLDPDKNIGAGAKYLGQMLKLSHGDETRAALAYHSGPGSADIKAYDRGDYGAISHWGQDYITKVSGNAQGGQLAQDHFGSAEPTTANGYQHLNVPQTPTPGAGQEAVPTLSPFMISGQEREAIPDPNAVGDVSNLYAADHEGYSQTQQENLSTFHGTEAATAHYLKQSTLGGILSQEGSYSGANTITSSLFNQSVSEQRIKALDESGVDSRYWAIINPNVSDQEFNDAIQMAKKRQEEDAAFSQKVIGVGANLAGGTIGMLGDPTTYGMLLMPGGEAALAEKMGGSGLTRFASNMVKRAGTDAMWGAASENMRAKTVGGDADVARAAIGAVLLGSTMHTMGAAAGRVKTRLRADNIEAGDLSQTVSSEAPVGKPGTTTMAGETVETMGSDLDPLHSQARRLEESEAARTHGAPEPNLKNFNGQEAWHVDSQGNIWTHQEPVESDGHPLDHGPAPDIARPNGQQVDGANIFNPATQSAAAHLREEFKEPELFTQDAPLRAAKGVSLGDTLTDIGYRVNTIANDKLRQLGNALMHSTTGFVNAAGEWMGGRLGKWAASEIVEHQRSLDNTHLSQLLESVKDLNKSVRYAGMTDDGAKDLMWRRLVEAREDSTGVKRAALSTQEQKAVKALDAFYESKHHYLTNVDHYGTTNAPSLISKEADGKTYTSIVYDHQKLHDFVAYQCGGDEKLAQAVLASSWLRSYHADPKIKARVDNEMQNRHFNDPEQRQLHEKAIKDAEEAVRKVSKKADKQVKKAEKAHATAMEKLNNKTSTAKQEFDALGEKDAHTRGWEERSLREAGLDTQQGLEAKAQEIYMARLRRFKKERTPKQLEKVMEESIHAAEKEASEVARKARSNANVEWQNARRRAEKFDNDYAATKKKLDDALAAERKAADRAIKDREAKVKTAEEKMKQPLNAADLDAAVEKYAKDTAFGVINQGKPEDAQTLAGIQKALDQNNVSGVGNTGFRKARSLFGYDTEIQMPDGSTFSPNDLRHFNQDEIIPLYARQMNGQIALTGATGMLPEDLMRYRNELAAELQVPKGMKLSGDDAVAHAKAQSDMDAIDEAFKLILGRKRNKDVNAYTHTITQSLGSAAYTLRNANFWSNNIGETGAIATARIQQGAINSSTDLSRLTNPGAVFDKADQQTMHNMLLGHEMVQHLDPKGAQAIVDDLINRGMNKTAANVLGRIQYGAQWAAHHSPFSKLMINSTQGIISFAQRDVMSVIAQDAMEAAGKAIYLSKERLNSAGLTPEQGEMIRGLFKDHAVVKDGKIKIKDYNAMMHDYRAAHLIRLSRAMSAEAIQKETIASSSTKALGGWMGLGLQFKRFPMKAMNQKFMRSWHEAHGNGRVFDQASTAIIGLGLSTTVYALQAQMNALGMSKARRKEYLRMKFDPKMMAYAAFARHSQFGGPIGVMTNIASILGYDPAQQIKSTNLPVPGREQKSFSNQVFNGQGLTNYLGGQFLNQFPAFGLVANGIGLGANLGKAAFAKDSAAQDAALIGAYHSARNVASIDPASQAGVRMLFEHLGHVNTDAK